jgi:SAM-dependent methyltransferase
VREGPARPARRCPACGSAAVALLRAAEAIGRDLARARRGLDGFLHGDARAVFLCGPCGSAFREPLGAPADDCARYAAWRYRPDTLERLRRRGRAELDLAARPMRARGVAPGARLLEVGSYAGAFLEFARDHGARATGVDVNPDVVAHCDARGLDVRCEAFDADRLGDGQFDGVWILNCFEQLPDHDRALAGAARLLRPGGTLVIRTPNAAFVRALYGARECPALHAVASANALLGVPFAKCFSPAALTRAIEAHGLRVVRLEGRPYSAAAGAGGPVAAWLEATARLAAPRPAT